MTIQELKQYLKRNKITYEKLAEMCNGEVSISTIKDIMRGKTADPRIKTLQTILRVLGLPTNDIDVLSIPGIEPLPTFSSVPLIGSIACGAPILAEENIEAFVRMPEKVNADFALRCKGDSMINARIFDGDIVFIRQQPDVENGQIAAVLIENEATLKRVYKYPNRLELRAENPMYAPMNFEGAELENIRILGLAVAFMSSVN